MGNIGLPEIIILVLIVLLIFGAKKLPEIGKALGEAIKQFKKAGKDEGDPGKKSEDDSPEEA